MRPADLQGVLWHVLLFFFLWALGCDLGGAQTLLFPVPDVRSLSGNFGELRSTHYHAGIDIRSEAGEGMRVVAAADGFVWRVGISSTGYGRSIFLRHPDGRYTVYGHLKRFSPQIEAWVVAQQKSRKQTNLTLDPMPGQFPVKAGDLIGLSGNTGSSQGPHLHFEYRDANGYLNPLPQFRTLLPDNLPPRLDLVAFQPTTPEARVDGRPEMRVWQPLRTGNNWYDTTTIFVHGPVGFLFAARDYLDGSGNFLDLYRATLLLDGQTVYQYQFDRINYNEQAEFWRHFDTYYWMRTGTKLQRTWDQALASFFKTPARGLLNLTDDAPHRLELRMEDAHGNQSRYTAIVQRGFPPSYSSQAVAKRHGLRDDYPKGKHVAFWDCWGYLNAVYRGPTDAVPPGCFVLLRDGSQADLGMAHAGPGYWLWRSSKPSPTALSTGKANPWPVAVRFRSGTQDDTLSLRYLALSPNARQPKAGEARLDSAGVFSLHIPSGVVPQPLLTEYEVLPARTLPGKAILASRIVRVGDPNWLTAQNFTLGLSPAPLEANLRSKRLFCSLGTDGKPSYVARDTSASLGSFGTYALVVDTVAPVLSRKFNTHKFKASDLPLDIEFWIDELIGIDGNTLQAKLDAKWHPAEIYPSQKRIVVWLPEGLAPGLHTLQLELKDYAKNQGSLVYTFEVLAQ